jgi:glycosyltransferase involved in cell wall biosynthesis
MVLPNDIDDPARPSGGNIYDRRLCDGLSSLGTPVREHAVAGDWPLAGRPARAELAARLAALPDGALVVVDGLIGSAAPEVLAPQADRLRLVILVHMPLGAAADGPARTREAAALSCAAAVVTTSRWTRTRVLELYDLSPDRVSVAAPGVDAAPVAPGTRSGGRLLCVAAVTHHKGHDVLLRALGTVSELAWQCVCAGDLHRDPAFVASVLHEGREVRHRVGFPGPLRREELAARYAEADLLVLPSRGEAYGMVVTEALARGIPVLATATQGVPEALGHARDGSRPGILVPPGDAPALAAALRRWLVEPGLRTRLRDAARDRRTTLAPWTRTVAVFAAALSRATRNIGIHSGR